MAARLRTILRMKTSSPIVLASCFLVGGLIAGFGAGYLVRLSRDTRPPATEQIAEQETARSAPRPAPVATGESPVLSNPSASALRELLSFPAPSSPEFAERVRELFADPMDRRRISRLQLAMENFTSAQFEAMIPLIRENDLRGMGSGREWEILWQNWARRHGEAAARHLDASDWSQWNPQAEPGARYNALIGWGANDPERALAYLAARGETGGQSGDLRHALFQGWVGRDPETAAAWLLKNQPGDIDRRSFQTIVDAICRKGGQPLLESWFASLPKGDDASYQQFASAVTHAKGRFQPAETLAWLEQQRGQPWVENSDALASATSRMARENPKAAMQWAAHMDSPRAAGSAMTIWYGSDPMSASQWLAANQHSPQYDAATATLVRYLWKDDPEAAAAWAKTIKDPGLRQRMEKR